MSIHHTEQYRKEANPLTELQELIETAEPCDDHQSFRDTLDLYTSQLLKLETHAPLELIKQVKMLLRKSLKVVDDTELRAHIQDRISDLANLQNLIRYKPRLR